MTLVEKRELLVEKHGKLVALNSKAAEEKRELTKDEGIEFDSIMKESEDLRSEIQADEDRAANLGKLKDYMEKRKAPVVGSKAAEGESKPKEKEYRSLGDWLVSPETVEQMNTRAMSMGDGSSGGVVVPDQFMSNILQMSGEGAIVRPRAVVLEPGTNPDAKITIPVFNQFGDNGIDGGMDLQWIDEGGTKPDNTPAFTYIELEPKEIGGSTIITDKLLRNAPAMGNWLERQYRELVMRKEEYQFLRGNGVGKPTGILGHASVKTHNRSTASTISFNDVANMLQNLKADSWGNAVWVASQTTLTQLITLTDDAGNSIFIQGNAAKGIPATLFGIPILFNGKVPTLGNRGDLSLLDMSYYIIKDGSGPYMAYSPHVYFTSNKTVVKMYKLTDGAPWVKTTLLLEDGETYVSPFVELV